MHPYPRRLCLVELSTSAQCGGSRGGTTSPPISDTPHYLSLRTIPNASPKPSRSADTSCSTVCTRLAPRSVLPCSQGAGLLPALSTHTHIPGATRVHRQLPARSKAACLRITPQIPEERRQCLRKVTAIKTNSKTGSTYLSTGG